MADINKPTPEKWKEFLKTSRKRTSGDPKYYRATKKRIVDDGTPLEQQTNASVVVAVDNDAGCSCSIDAIDDAKQQPTAAAAHNVTIKHQNRKRRHHHQPPKKNSERHHGRRRRQQQQQFETSIGTFPTPSQGEVVRLLKREFGLEELTEKDGTLLFQVGKHKFPSLNELRTHLCRNGLESPKEWFYQNMVFVEEYYNLETKEYGIHVPSTKQAKSVSDWIRLDILPREYHYPASSNTKAAAAALILTKLAKHEVQQLLGKMGITLDLGYYQLVDDGELMSWGDLERQIATHGLPERLWEHPGATRNEKLSLVLFFLDYKTISLRPDLHTVDVTPAQQQSTVVNKRPRRRVTQPPVGRVKPEPQEASNKVVRREGSDSRSRQRAEEEDFQTRSDLAVVAAIRASADEESPGIASQEPFEDEFNFDFPFYEEEEDAKPAARLGLEPIPPKRVYRKKKSVFAGSLRNLERAEFGGSGFLTSLAFWDTLGKPRAGAYTFAWGKAIGYRSQMGRVYYDWFQLGSNTIRVGDFVKLTQDGRKQGKGEFFKVVSAFQATRSFVGRWNSASEQLQNRGKAYVELVPLYVDAGDAGHSFLMSTAPEWNPGYVEGLPFCLFSDNECELESVDVTCNEAVEVPLTRKKPVTKPLTPNQHALMTESDALALTSRFALDSWPVAMAARFTVLYLTPREHKFDISRIPSQDYTIYDSDDSDGFDELSMFRNAENNFEWKAELERDSPLGSIPIHKSNNVAQPMVMFTGGPLRPEKVESKHLYEHLCTLEPWLEKCVQCDASLKSAVSSFKKELLSRTTTSRLGDYFSLHLLKNKQRGRNVEEHYAAKLRIQRYKNKIQELACRQAANREDKRDTIVIAPCGSGKSMVFVEAALRSGGVNIVIEPLNSIIKSQLMNLRHLSPDLQIEQLFSEEEANIRQVLGSRDRLQKILNDIKLEGPPRKPLLIYTTPELIEARCSQLKALADDCVLSNITIDEVDMIQQSNATYRGVYTELLQKLRKHCLGVKFIFLSGTITTLGLVGLLRPTSITQAPPDEEKPALYVHDRALADSLSFHVERKTNDEQVAERIVSWIKGYKRHPKCLCYCLTISRCHSMAQLLNARGVLSEAVTSKEKLNSMDSSLENFSKGRTAVLCCTGVLGRGFHVDDVRFVFHAAVPMDLTEYIQQAGRAGRDGKQAHCVLFYRAQDCMAVQRIRSRGYGESTSEIATAIEEDIAKIVTYCMSQECRYSQLACVATIDQCNPSDQRCTKAAPCDNCHTPGESVNLPLTTAFDSINGHATMLQPKRGHNNSLSDDLMNLFLKTKVLETEGGRRLRQGANFGHVHKLLTSADISFFVKCKQQKGVPSSSGSTEETKSTKPGEKVVAFEALNPMRLHQQEKSVMVSNPLDRLCIPFLVRFEAERVLKSSNSDKRRLSKIVDHFSGQVVGPHQCIAACKFLDGMGTRREMGRYASVLRESEKDNHASIDSFNDGVGVYYHAELNSTDFRLLPPERANNRRIFRRFGSHRFLHVKASLDVPDQKVIDTLQEKIEWCGRTYAYLWCKAQKAPQCFVLFAEKGIGIEEELSVDQVREWCIPTILNPELTIAKELKRLKLAFSKTTPSAILPENSLELIPDIFGREGREMTDGCGLLSRDALNHIWKSYSAEESLCPYSSLQGRIGGFKGLWVLDDSLGPGMQVKCRESQLKYKLPMKSMAMASDIHSTQGDSKYDTVDINSWDERAEKGYLSLRLVQILEHRGVSLDFFLGCADKGLDWLDDLAGNTSDNQANFFTEVLKRHRNIIAMNETEEDLDNDDILFRMASAELDPSEPHYAERRRNFIKKTADKIRNKARYPLKDAWHVRMIPDHIQLLQEGEAFVAVADEIGGTLNYAKEVLAFRNPSYFDGDLRKLKLVQYEELVLRAMDKGGTELLSKCRGFFKNLQSGLILSTVGDESEAERLSGGDFDGDKAWICFDPALVEQVADAEPALRPDLPEKHPKENGLATDVTVVDRIKFARHFKYHQRQLGYLANTLDRAMDMFEDYSASPEVTDIARQSFLQVDHPYQLCAPKLETANVLEGYKQPHWAENKAIADDEQPDKVYKSTKALGKLWDYVERKIELAVSHGIVKPNSHILELVDTACERMTLDRLAALKLEMRSAVIRYKLEIKELMVKKPSIETINEKSQALGHAERLRLIINPYGSEEDRTLAAAILYHECGDSKSFAWKVAHDYLINIVARAQNKKNDRLPPIMTHDMEKLAFGRSKK